MNRLELLYFFASRYPGLLRRWDFNSFRSFSLRPHTERFPLYSGEQTDAALYPVFIIGSGRSGNTLLRRVLMERFQIHIPPETYFLGSVIREYKRHCNLDWRSLATLIAEQIINSSGFHTFGIDNPNDFRQSMIGVEDKSLGGLLSNFYRYQARVTGAQERIWGDKTPMNTFYLNSISEVFPEARYIWIIRDGVDVVSSYVEAGLNNYDATLAAKRWVVSNIACEQLYLRLGAETFLQIRYEDLVRAPIDTSDVIAQFCGLAPKSRLQQEVATLGDVEQYQHHANVLRPINTGSIGKGRRLLDAGELKLLARTLDPWLIRWGYQRCVESVS